MRLAEENGIASIAFPAISTGVFGYPPEEAARVAFQTIRDELAKLSSVRLIRFVLFDAAAARLHGCILADVIGASAAD